MQRAGRTWGKTFDLHGNRLTPRSANAKRLRHCVYVALHNKKPYMSRNCTIQMRHMMFTHDQKSIDEMMKPGREAFEYWISFFPTAPLFGVEWRFGGMMGGMPAAPTKKPAPTKTKAATAKKAVAPKPAAPKPTTAESVAAKTVAKVEVKEAVTPAPTAAAPKIAAKPKKAVKKPTEVKAAAAPAPKPVKKAAPKTDGPAVLLADKPAKVDDLKLIKGIGPGLEKQLNKLGVYQFTQMAELKKADLEWIDERLTAFKGRCFRDDWTGQAKALLA